MNHSESRIKNFFLWLHRGIYAVLDQTLFGAANFILNILLARWLDLAQYGAFSVASAIFLFLAVLHTAVLTEPMMVFGVGKYKENFRQYIGILIYGHWGLTVIMAIGLTITGLFFWQFGSLIMAWTIISLGFASPFMLLFWLMRRGFYVHLQSKWAMFGSALYLMIMLLITFGFKSMGWLSSGSALLVMGLSGLLTSLVLLIILRPQLRFEKNQFRPVSILLDHWGYGSWNIFGQGLYWVSGQILIVLIPVFLGLSASASIAAVQNLFRPLNLIMQSGTLLALPILSATMNSKDSASLVRNQVGKFFLFFVGGSFLYGILITMFADVALHSLYRGLYDGNANLVFLFTLIYTAAAAVQVFTIVLKADSKVREVVFVWGFSAFLTLVLSVPILMMKHIEGTLLLYSVSYCIAAIMAWRIFLKSYNKVRGVKIGFHT